MDQFIKVVGYAERECAPDRGTWWAVVETKGRTERDAYSACGVALREVLSQLQQVAPPDAALSAGPINVWQEWDDTQRRRVGAAAGGRVTIRASLQDLPGLGQHALDGGAVRLDGPAYEVSGKAEVLNALAVEAVQAARVRAEQMAHAAGRELGDVVQIGDATLAADGPHLGVTTMALRAEAGPVSPELQLLRADVVVTFQLR